MRQLCRCWRTPLRPTPVRLVLASASPRRRALLEELGHPFAVEPVDLDEGVDLLGRAAASPGGVAEALALAKALACAARGGSQGQRGQGAIILGADTVVVAPGGALVGKAATEAEARAALGLLDGRWHEVVTGVALVHPDGRVAVFHARSEVRIGPLQPGDLEAYLLSGQWRGKAGAYGIQDRPTPVRELRGSFSNVVGLPLEALREALTGRTPALPVSGAAATLGPP